jgi:hypothetical protein
LFGKFWGYTLLENFTAGDYGISLADSGDGMARVHTFQALALVLSRATALEVTAMVLVKSVEFIEHKHGALDHLGDDERDVATVVGARVLNVAHGILRGFGFHALHVLSVDNLNHIV